MLLDDGKVLEPRADGEVGSEFDRDGVTSDFEPERGRGDDEDDCGNPNAL